MMVQKMKIDFGGYYQMPLDFNKWPKEEQEKYIKIGTEDGWLDLNPNPPLWYKIKYGQILKYIKKAITKN